MSAKQLTQTELMHQFPKAFAALPEAYQADSCLEFFLLDGWLTCGPKEDQEDMLGAWVATYCPDHNTWETEHFIRTQ